MLSDRLLLLIGKKISGDATAAELEELQALQAQHPESLELEQMAASLQQVNTTFVELEDGGQVLNKGWKAVSEELGREPHQRIPHRSILLRKWPAAAAIAGAIALLLVYFLRQSPAPQQSALYQNRVSTKHGSKSRIELPDGTKVWLNAGSRLTYADGFLNGNREVTLVGEAYFDVIGEAGRPLVVNTRHMKITVLGTRFNVRAYAEDNLAEATLLSGKIAITLNDRENRRIVLKPLQKLSIRQQAPATLSVPIPQNLPAPATVQARKQSAEATADETAWVYNRLSFKKESFDDVVRKMERWYDVTIRVENDALRTQLLSGEFTTESVEQALKALQFTTDFKFNIKGDTVTIR
jgi:transmembrane sensor